MTLSEKKIYYIPKSFVLLLDKILGIVLANFFQHHDKI